MSTMMIGKETLLAASATAGLAGLAVSYMFGPGLLSSYTLIVAGIVFASEVFWDMIFPRVTGITL